MKSETRDVRRVPRQPAQITRSRFACHAFRLSHAPIFSAAGPMQRFHVGPDGPRSHHGLHVLRLRPGERVVVLDGAGHEYLCDAKELKRDSIELAVIQKNDIPSLPYQITLLQAVPKGKGFEAILQKATELEPVALCRCFRKELCPPGRGEGREQTGEVERGAIDACKQCGSAWLVQIDSPIQSRPTWHSERSTSCP